MKKTKKEWIDTIRLITSVIALSITMIGLIRRVMEWSEANKGME